MIHLDLIELLSNCLYTQSLTEANISSNEPAYTEAIQTYGLLLQGLMLTSQCKNIQGFQILRSNSPSQILLTFEGTDDVPDSSNSFTCAY